MKQTPQEKRKVSKAESTKLRLLSHTKGPDLRRFPSAIYFPEVCGKTVAGVYVRLDVNDNCVTLTFSDKTALSFAIESGFTVRADYSDWKAGYERIIKRSARLRSASVS